jgi:predicted ATP-dependent serine protease
MTDKGLREVANPSAIFLSRYDEAIPGSIVMISREGTRPYSSKFKLLLMMHTGNHVEWHLA